jgi:Ca2+-binding EF-hand superfamily protein
MNRIARTLAIASLAASSAFFLPAAQATNDVNPNAFVKQCDTDKDGMVSKAEVMKHVEMMFDKMDTKKMGKLDKKQVEAFLKSFMMLSGS